MRAPVPFRWGRGRSGAGGRISTQHSLFLFLLLFFGLFFNARAVLAGRTTADGLNGGRRTVGHVSPLQQPPAPLPAGRPMLSGSRGGLRSVTMLDLPGRGGLLFSTVRPPTPLKPLVKLVDLSTLIRISIHDRAEMVRVLPLTASRGRCCLHYSKQNKKTQKRNWESREASSGFGPGWMPWIIEF